MRGAVIDLARHIGSGINDFDASISYLLSAAVVYQNVLRAANDTARPPWIRSRRRDGTSSCPSWMAYINLTARGRVGPVGRWVMLVIVVPANGADRTSLGQEMRKLD